MDTREWLNPLPCLPPTPTYNDFPRPRPRSRSRSRDRDGDVVMGGYGRSFNLPTPQLTHSSSTSSSSSFSSSASSLVWPLSATLQSNPIMDIQIVDSPESLHRQVHADDLLHQVLGHQQERKLKALALLQPPPAPEISNNKSYREPFKEKDRFVDGLLDTCELAISSIWGPSPGPDFGDQITSVLPLRCFIRETLRRSRTSCSTLQLALYYLHRSRNVIRHRVNKAEIAKKFFNITRSKLFESLPTPPNSPNQDLTLAAKEVLSTSKDPVICGRRMFLAAVMLASKFLQDRNYSTRAWSKISGLPIVEINANERALLHVLDYDLFVRPELFDNWMLRLKKLSNSERCHPNETVLPLSPPLSPNQTRPNQLVRSSSNYSPAPAMQLSPKAGPPPNLRRLSLDSKNLVRSFGSARDLSRLAFGPARNFGLVDSNLGKSVAVR